MTRSSLTTSTRTVTSTTWSHRASRATGGGSAGDQRVKKKKTAVSSFDKSDGEVVVTEPRRENANSFDIPIFTEEFPESCSRDSSLSRTPSSRCKKLYLENTAIA